jgi:serine/threonine-protein kinase
MTSIVLQDRLVAATGDRFRIEGEIGRGGMAVVYAATDVRLRRAVAIKVLPPELAFRTDVKERFLREAQMAAGLAHPHIVPIHSVEEHDGLVFMVMGRVHGESLAARLHREPRMPFTVVRRILRETADALAHAHAKGVVHRDIKPDNILLEDGTGRVLVTDFGIARAAEGDARLTVTGVAVGTPTYMSPEQARGDADVDGRADLYSLGVVGYQMLAGEPPFSAPNTPALLLKHVIEPPPPLSGKRVDAPRALVYAVERALEKDRGARWADAASLRVALADDAPEPNAASTFGQHRAVAVAAPPEPAADPKYPALPPYPAWRGGGSSERDQWRAAQAEWRDRVRAQQSAWMEDLQARQAARREERSGRPRSGEAKTIAQRLGEWQRKMLWTVPLAAFLFMVNAGTGGFPWFFFAWFGLFASLVSNAVRLWQDGLRFTDFFRRPSLLEGLEQSRPVAGVSKRPVLAANSDDARLAALVSADVAQGQLGATVRRAIEDERAVLDTLQTLAPADRAQLPDVEPTVRSLVTRVASLAESLHRLDRDLTPGQIEQLERRLADARSQPESADRDRRVQLLERQATTLHDLASRRGTLVSQLENASLVLQTMRLDLLRLRSHGIGNASADINNVTQEARALALDIERVVGAAAEVRAL